MLIFVNKKSELTEFAFLYSEYGQDIYRSRLNCNCEHGKNRRDGILVIDRVTGILEAKIVRCKRCVGDQLNIANK